MSSNQSTHRNPLEHLHYEDEADTEKDRASKRERLEAKIKGKNWQSSTDDDEEEGEKYELQSLNASPITPSYEHGNGSKEIISSDNVSGSIEKSFVIPLNEVEGLSMIVFCLELLGRLREQCSSVLFKEESWINKAYVACIKMDISQAEGYQNMLDTLKTVLQSKKQAVQQVKVFHCEIDKLESSIMEEKGNGNSPIDFRKNVKKLYNKTGRLQDEIKKRLIEMEKAEKEQFASHHLDKLEFLQLLILVKQEKSLTRRERSLEEKEATLKRNEQDFNKRQLAASTSILKKTKDTRFDLIDTPHLY